MQEEKFIGTLNARTIIDNCNKTLQTFRGTSSEGDGFNELVYLKLSQKNITETKVESCHEVNLLGLVRRMALVLQTI